MIGINSTKISIHGYAISYSLEGFNMKNSVSFRY